MTDTEIKNQKLSNEELKELATGLENFGDMLIMMGTLAKLEEKLTSLEELMEKLFHADNRDLFLAMETNPELMAKATEIITKWRPLAGKDPMELLPDEQIEVGTSFKEFSSLLTEVIGGTAQDEAQSE
ncbi:MAG: hypothetical protein ACXQS5_07700 [Candidatus Methanospirareceae archaeon]